MEVGVMWAYVWRFNDTVSSTAGLTAKDQLRNAARMQKHTHVQNNYTNKKTNQIKNRWCVSAEQHNNNNNNNNKSFGTGIIFFF